MQGNINTRNRNNILNNTSNSRSTIKTIPRFNSGGSVGGKNNNNIISGGVGGSGGINRGSVGNNGNVGNNDGIGHSRGFNPLQGKPGFNSKQSSLPSGASNYKNKPIGQGITGPNKKNLVSSSKKNISSSSFVPTKSRQSSVNFYDKYSKNPLSSLVHVRPLTDNNVISRFQRAKDNNNNNSNINNNNNGNINSSIFSTLNINEYICNNISEFDSLQNQTEQVSFPIDLVYTWVNGSDTRWLQKKQMYQIEEQANVPSDSILECRWRDLEELKYSIESAYVFAPWIRKIFVVTDHQRPYWFDENNPGKVEFIDHSVLFEGFEDHIPTFNSHAIESHLNQIPDLSEHFIYANDDTFFGNIVSPLDFFTSDGHNKVFLSLNNLETEESLRNNNKLNKSMNNSKSNKSFGINSRFSSNIPKLSGKTSTKSKNMNMNATNNAAINAINNVATLSVNMELVPYFTSQIHVNNVLDQVFGKSHAPRKRLKHQMKPLRKSIFDYCWDHEITQAYLFNTSMNKFRQLSDVDPVGLISHVGLILNQSIPDTILSTYYAIKDNMDVRKIFTHLYKFKPSPKLYCINDASGHMDDRILEYVMRGFERFLPHRVFLVNNINVDSM